MRGSMLPPVITRPTRRPSKRAGSASTAASPAAPAPSATVFSMSRSRLMASSMVSSRHEHLVVDQRGDDRLGERPARGTAMPSAMVVPPIGRSACLHGVVHRGVEVALHADQLDVRAQVARRRRPCRPAGRHRRSGTTSTSRSGASASSSRAHGALAGDDERVVVRRHPHEAVGALQRLGQRRRLGEVVAVQHDLGAERLGAAHLHVGREAGHHDGGRDAEPGGVVGDALGVVAGRHGHDAPRAARPA